MDLMTDPQPGDPTVDLLAGYAIDLFQSLYHAPAPDEFQVGDAFTGHLEDIPRLVCRHLRRLPARFRRATVASLGPEQCCGDVAAFAVRNDPAATLMIGGNVGSGKTHAAAACATAFAVEAIGRGRTMQGRVEWWSVAGLLDALRPSAEDPEGTWRRAKDAPLLVLDDLGQIRVTDWAVERLWMLVDHRYVQCLPQVVTTNADWSGLTDAWGAATMDRLRADARVLDFAGDSRRRRADA